MRNWFGATFALLACCGAVQAQPVEHDLAWLAAEVDGPVESPGRTCLESGMSTLYALNAFQTDRMSDVEVRASFLKDVVDPDLIIIRTADADRWVGAHDPADVAADHLGRCLAASNIRLVGNMAAKPCFKVFSSYDATVLDQAVLHENARGLAACLRSAVKTPNAPAARFAAPCVVLLGGGGTRTGNEQLDGSWFQINGVVSQAAADRLTAGGYDVRPLIVSEPDGDQRFAALWSTLTETHCAKTVQISHELKAVDGRLKAFSIHAEVLHISTPTGTDRRATPVADYKKAYEYPMTSEIMEKLSLSGLGNTIADGIAAANVLPKP